MDSVHFLEPPSFTSKSLLSGPFRFFPAQSMFMRMRNVSSSCKRVICARKLITKEQFTSPILHVLKEVTELDEVAVDLWLTSYTIIPPFVCIPPVR